MPDITPALVAGSFSTPDLSGSNPTASDAASTMALRKYFDDMGAMNDAEYRRQSAIADANDPMNLQIQALKKKAEYESLLPQTGVDPVTHLPTSSSSVTMTSGGTTKTIGPNGAPAIVGPNGEGVLGGPSATVQSRPSVSAAAALQAASRDPKFMTAQILAERHANTQDAYAKLQKAHEQLETAKASGSIAAIPALHTAFQDAMKVYEAAQSGESNRNVFGEKQTSMDDDPDGYYAGIQKVLDAQKATNDAATNPQ